jgi:enoyl-CoA hydratase
VPLVDGGTYRLPRIVGLGRALDLILTGREIDAAEAERIGFVDRLVPAGTALDAAVALAAEIAAFPWACVVSDRRSVYDGLGLSVADALANEDRLGREVIMSEDFREGVARFEARRRE